MLNSKSILNCVAAFALVFSAALFFSNSAEAYSCKSTHIHAPGSAKMKGIAKSKAKALWVKSVKQQHGLEWSVWNIAAAKLSNCSKQNGKYKCWASAKPCKYVVQ